MTTQAGPRPETVPSPGRPAPRRRAPRGLLLAGAGVGAATLLPLAYLIVRASDGGLGGVADALGSARTAGLLGNTVSLAAAVTAASIAVAVPMAWLTERTDLPGRRLFTVLFALPLVIPSYVGAYVFVAALGPRGMVQGWLEPLGVQRLPDLTGFLGAWLVLTAVTYPYVYLTVRAAIRGLDPALEEVARGLGHGRPRIARSVVLPQLRPSIVAGGLLAALYTLHDFGAVSLLRYDTFTRAIFLQYRGSFDRSRAAMLGLVLVALALIVVVAEARSRGRRAYHRLHGGGARPPVMTVLGRWRWPAVGASGIFVLLTLGLPVGIVATWLARSLDAGNPLSLTFGAAANSVRVSGIAAVVGVAAAWPIAVLGTRYRGLLTGAFERVSYLGFALPGIVVALALVFFGARYAPAVYQTRALLVFAYVVLFLSHAVGSLRTSLVQLNPSLEEAAASLGAGRWRTLRRVVLPLVRPGVLAGLALVFLTAMKELPATLLLAPTGFDTLATEVWSATNAAAFGRAAAPALGLILLSSLPLAVLLMRRGGRET